MQSAARPQNLDNSSCLIKSFLSRKWGWLGSHCFCFFLALVFLAGINNGRLAFSGTPKIFELSWTKIKSRLENRLSEIVKSGRAVWSKKFCALILWADQKSYLGLSQDTTIESSSCPKTISSTCIWLNRLRLSYSSASIRYAPACNSTTTVCASRYYRQ